MRTHLFKHTFAAAAGSAAIILSFAGVASAHLDADPIAIQAGSTATVAFTVEHGCDGSPTIDVQFQIPDGVTGVAPVDKAGWTTTVSGDVVEFKGGSLPADQEDDFEITLTAPTGAGEIHFPAIQTCEQGNIGWIEIPEEGAAEPENPAPTIKITEGPPTAEDLTPAPEETDATTETTVTEATTASSVTAATDGTVVALETSVAAAPAETNSTTETSVTGVTDGTVVALETAVTAVASADDDSSNTGAIVAIVVVAALALIGGGILLARRKNAASPPTP